MWIIMVAMEIADSYELCVQVLNINSNHKKKENWTIWLHSSGHQNIAMATARVVVLSPAIVDMLSSKANLTPHLV